MSSDFPDSGYDIDDFKAGVIVAVEFQILLHNFKISKKINTVKVYSFLLLRVYLVDNPIHSIILMPNKHQHREDK